MAVGIFCLVFGLFAAIGAVVMGLKTLKVRGWPQVEATLVEKAVIPTDEAGPARRAKWKVRVAFDYEFGGQRWQSRTLKPQDDTFSRAAAEAVIADLGPTASAWVNPDDPSEAYLQTLSLTYPILGFIAGLLGLLVGFSMLARPPG